jgi:redox-sensitive bicupin YhaK (pirin superfamily)
MMAHQQTSFPMSVETEIVPATRDLGDGFKVRRALPSMKRRMVGPFVFLDEMGPAQLAPGEGLDVRPHPHIGLATVTYLFDGEILHQDSLGVRQPIRPGDVNWMTAGRGIVHSERTPQPLRPAGPRAWGLQAWVALPERDEECAPGFTHHGMEDLPKMEGEGLAVRLIAGEGLGLRSPVQTLSPMFYADVALEPGAQLAVAPDYEERACYIADGRIEIDGQAFDRGRLLVFRPAEQVLIAAPAAKARVMLLGGEPLGPRYVWWNFVSSSRERIEAAKADWKAGRFAAVPGDPEFIPLPEDRKPPPVDYP